MQPPNFLSKHFVCHVFPISQWWGTLQTSHLECPPLRIGMYFAGKGMKKLLQKAAKGNERISRKIIQVVMRVIFRNCGFVRFPVFGTISGPHLECVQRILFVLFHSNFLVQALSNGRFWLQESDFGLNKWCQVCFWRKLPPKPASSIQLKSFMFGRLVTGILHKKGWPENPESKINLKLFTFQSSRREVRGHWHT